MSNNNLEQEIITLIETNIAPVLARHNGQVAFRRVEDNRVYLTLQGACRTCPSTIKTLKLGIEKYLREELKNPTLEVINEA